MNFKNVDLKNFIFYCYPFSGFYIHSVSSSTRSPEPHWERFDGGIPLRAECFNISHSLYNVLLWVSTFSPYPAVRNINDGG